MAKYPDVSADAYRLRKAKEVKKAEVAAPIRFTGDGQYEPVPWEYSPSSPLTTVLEKHVILSDIHGPYVDQPSFKAVLDFIRDFKPTHIDLLGDVADMWEISRYTKDPMRKMYLGREVGFTIDIVLAELRAAAKNAVITWVSGNHEARLQKYLWTRAPELSSLPSLDMRNLFELDKLRIRYQDTPIMAGNVLMTHGHMARKGSGVTARAMLDEYGQSVIHGHTHRLGAVYKTSGGNAFLAFENGCLCQLTPDFLPPGTVNWQHGFSVGYLMSDGNYHFQQILIGPSNTFAFNGRVYGVAEPVIDCHV